MPGCSAPNCSNSTKKGYLMKVFPQDAQLRTIWVTNVWRKYRTLQKEHRLCDVHFAPEMWETKRLDGKRQLVYNAVPTLFWQYVKNATVTNPGGMEKIFVDIRPTEAIDESIVEPQNVQEELTETHAIMEDCEAVGIDDKQVCNVLQQDASKVVEVPLDPCTDNDMKPIKSGNYDFDDRSYLSGFLDYTNKHKKSNKMTNSTNDLSQSTIHFQNVKQLSSIDMNILYNVAGYLVKSIVHLSKNRCVKCAASVSSKEPELSSYATFVRIRCFKTNTLFFVNHCTFEVFLQMEYFFRKCIKSVKQQPNINVLRFFTDQFESLIVGDHIAVCHNLRSKIIKRFAAFRIKVACKKNQPKKRHYDSKTMAMHSIKK